jgi:hypothetical protein
MHSGSWDIKWCLPEAASEIDWKNRLFSLGFIIFVFVILTFRIMKTKTIAFIMLAMISLGFDLGYQFVFWKRLTIDLMVFGPSLRYSYGKGEISGDLDLDEDQIEAIDDEMAAKLIERFPLLSQIFSDESLSFNGSRSTFDTGFRYTIQVGFHF